MVLKVVRADIDASEILFVAYLPKLIIKLALIIFLYLTLVKLPIFVFFKLYHIVIDQFDQWWACLQQNVVYGRHIAFQRNFSIEQQI